MGKVKLLIIGAGPGGYVSAIRAAQLGLEPVIIEKNELGGTCLNRGCIPTKALISAAERYNSIKTAEKFGIYAKPEFKWDKVVEQAKNIINRNIKGVEYLFKKNKIRLITGNASFVSNNTIEINNEQMQAEHIIIATGSKVKSLPGINIDREKVISSDEAIFLEELPESIAILGAGAVGVEFAYIFNSFGVEVHIIEAMNSLIPLEDREISKEILRTFKKTKIKSYLSTKVKKIEETDDSQLLVYLYNDKTFTVDKLLCAAGRMPETENLGIENTDIKLTGRGYIKVDKQFNTNVKGVYAIGDLIDTPMLAHTAEHEGVSLVERIAGINNHEIDYNLNPSCIYCEPSIASVGITEQLAEEKDINIVTGKFPFTANGKAVASGYISGFVKVIAEKDSHKIIGAHIIGHGATDLISEFLSAMKMESTLEDMSRVIHPHPTLSEVNYESVLEALGRSIHI